VPMAVWVTDPWRNSLACGRMDRSRCLCIIGHMEGRIYIETSVISYLKGRLSTDTIVAAHRWRIESLVEEAGYVCPIICTPEELMED